MYAKLHKNKFTKSITIHRLVFRAFVKNPKRLPEINHKDGDKRNNVWLNLEPSTRRLNMIHAIQLGLARSMVGTENIMAKLTESKVRKIRKLFADGVSQSRLAAMFNITFQNVHCIVRRKSWKFLK